MTKDDLWRIKNLHTDDRHTDVRELVEKHRLHSILVTTGATQVLQQGNYIRLRISCYTMLQKQPYFSASAITFSLAIINLLRSALVMCFHGKVSGIPASSRGETGSMLGSGERWLVEGSDFLESLVSLSLTFASLNLSLSRLFCSWDSALRRRSLRILSVESSCFFLRS